MKANIIFIYIYTYIYVDRCFQRGKSDLKTVLKSLKYQLSEKPCFRKLVFQKQQPSWNFPENDT